ncbi:unnamed protein product [Caenorhabditis angaria]|uniref:Uncharacterized protein n=1 Tax=Caenorhabditis angaria TaxID=860376 RepID=A0A9P1N6Z6_9PELO|nr:unnamed protein product [Caenorhabditis angaria]
MKGGAICNLPHGFSAILRQGIQKLGFLSEISGKNLKNDKKSQGKAGNSSFSSKIASKMPKIFTYNAKPISTFYTDSIPSKSHTRTTDHFPMLKKLKKPRKSLGQLKFEHCNIGAAEETASIISKPSFLRLSVAKTPGKPPKGSISSEKILIDLGDCHWMRVWITKTSNWEKDYAKTIDREIGQTIDFIFGAGIGFLPDRENAIIIPYSPENIAKISIDHHGDGLAQISFGENLGNFLNSWSFNMPILKESGYFVYLIRAPKCRANFDVDFGALGLFGAGGDGAKPYSRIEFKQCEIRMIQK